MQIILDRRQRDIHNRHIHAYHQHAHAAYRKDQVTDVTRFAEGAATLFKLGNRFEDLLCSADMRKSREDRLKGEVLHLR